MSSIRDVAAAAGVSRMTVSNVINGRHHKASQATIERVLQAIDELDYVPDAPARSLAANRSRMIGLVVHHPDEKRPLLENPHDALLLGAIEHAVSSAGFSFISASSPDVVATVRLLGSWRTDGLIVYGSVADEINELQRTQPRPLVFLDNYSHQPDVQVVGVDDVGGGLAAGRHLIALGHRRIAFAGALHSGLGVVGHRLQGLEQAAEEVGSGGEGPVRESEEDPVGESVEDPVGEPVSVLTVEADHHPLAPARVVQELLSLPDPPTAIVASSDVLAAEILGELRDRGVDVPGAISVVGFDDTAVARWVRPQLTTVAQDVRGKGRAAVSLLMELIEGADVGSRADVGSGSDGRIPGASGTSRSVGPGDWPHRMPMQLAIRDSTAPPP